MAEVLPDNFHYPNFSMGQRSIQKSVLMGPFLKVKDLHLMEMKRLFSEASGPQKSPEYGIFLVGTLHFLLINFVFSRSRS